MKRCIVVVAGPMGPYEPVKALLRPDDAVICADGGQLHAKCLGLKPMLAVGDFDSSSMPEDIPVKRVPKEKDDTDTLLAVREAIRMGYKEILILGGLRGRLDHTLANLGVLLWIAQNGADGVIADGGNEVRVLLEGGLRLKRREDVYVSVFPAYGRATGVTERGLKYPLEDAELVKSFPLGVSNEFAAEEAFISVKNGPLFIIFSKKEAHPGV